GRQAHGWRELAHAEKEFVAAVARDRRGREVAKSRAGESGANQRAHPRCGKAAQQRKGALTLLALAGLMAVKGSIADSKADIPKRARWGRRRLMHCSNFTPVPLQGVPSTFGRLECTYNFP